jgi:hypothetical protein
MVVLVRAWPAASAVRAAQLAGALVGVAAATAGPEPSVGAADPVGAAATATDPRRARETI